MKWRFWNRRPNVANPRIVVELLDDAHVDINCDWPEYQTDLEKSAFGKNFAQLVYYLNDGRLLPLIQQAIAVTGHVKDQKGLSVHILSCMERLLEASGENDKEAAVDRPVIEADQVFSRE